MNKQPKILYIDDEADLLLLASTFFEDESLPIETSSTYNDALNRIRNGSYDLIISDAKMPTGSGIDLLRTIKKEGVFHGKSILVTGNYDRENITEKNLYDLVLLKPLKFQELVNEAKKMLSL